MFVGPRGRFLYLSEEDASSLDENSRASWFRPSYRRSFAKSDLESLNTHWESFLFSMCSTHGDDHSQRDIACEFPARGTLPFSTEIRRFGDEQAPASPSTTSQFCCHFATFSLPVYLSEMELTTAG